MLEEDAEVIEKAIEKACAPSHPRLCVDRSENTMNKASSNVSPDQTPDYSNLKLPNPVMWQVANCPFDNNQAGTAHIGLLKVAAKWESRLSSVSPNLPRKGPYLNYMKVP